MTADQLREALAKLGWSQREAAHNLEVAPRLLRYWAAGDWIRDSFKREFGRRLAERYFN